VGAVLAGLALVAFALAAGWASGAAFDGYRAQSASGDCSGECAAEVAGSAVTPPPSRPALAAPQPSPEPDDLPYVSAGSIAVVESACGALLFGRNEHLRLPPASLTKLMTAAVATDQADTATMIVTNVDGERLFDETGSTVMGLRPGMELSLLDLLYGLLLPSGNDAAIAIAEGVSRTQEQFVALMNEKAKSLALDDSHFMNAHGLYDPGHYSSAHDMAILARYVMQNAELREIVSTISWQPRWDGPEVWNGNQFISQYDGADGVKIGYTEESQQTIVASATRDGRRIIAALMKSQDRYQDAQRMLDWAFEQPSACP
jgi:D-alanyl-D-alanine carboxypeptidase